MPVDEPRCAECGEREYAFESARSSGIYEGVLKDAIHELKYKSRVVLADPLAELMARCYPDTRLAGTVDLAIPVPIHRTRLVERGFNQAEELALKFCARVRLPVETNVLVKKRKTPHQANLSHDLRAINVEGVFAVRDPASVRAYTLARSI
jgi:predicted amidophosphoribosyltransferase